MSEFHLIRWFGLNLEVSNPMFDNVAWDFIGRPFPFLPRIKGSIGL